MVLLSGVIQKQPAEVFYKRRCYLKNWASSHWNFAEHILFVVTLHRNYDYRIQQELQINVKTCARVSFIIKLWAWVNTFFTEHLWTTASVDALILQQNLTWKRNYTKRVCNCNKLSRGACSRWITLQLVKEVTKKFSLDQQEFAFSNI